MDLQIVRDFVEKLFKDKLSAAYLYHNFTHTSFVAGKAETLISHSPISAEEREKILLAVWFHDTGYTVSAENHEEHSVEIFRNFARENGISEEFANEVSNLILATKKDRKPQTLPEKIMKDADTAHIGAEDYPEAAKNLRKEWEQLGIYNFGKDEWKQKNLHFLRDIHHFYTDFAMENWNPQKLENIKNIEEKLEKSSKPEKITENKPKKEEKGDRSVDTFFRVILNNHSRLSYVADRKANILLSVNAIIISFSLSVLMPKLGSQKNVHLVIPTFIMLIFSVVSIIFAILSTKPNVSKANFSQKDVDERKVNLLFFGNFIKLDYQNYLKSMEDMLHDREYLQDSMLRDLYYLGKVLDRKYRLLSMTYKIFMAGIVTSTIAFVIAYFYN